MTKKKVVFCTPSLTGPTKPYIKALEDSIPLIIAAGWDEGYAQEIANPYISGARAAMTRKALDAQADVIVYLDYDLSWDPQDLLTLIETEGDVVAGTYRIKQDEPEYMSTLYTDAEGRPMVARDGTLSANKAPAGFLKVTSAAIDRYMTAYPELCYGPKFRLSVDLFNHGAHKGVWWGEDYAFSRRWIEMGERIALIPNLNLTHWQGDKAYPGNFHEFLLHCPGGQKAA